MKLLLCVIVLVWWTGAAYAQGWQVLPVPGAGGLVDGIFLNADTGWVVGARVIYCTPDGGQSWQEQFRDTSSYSVYQAIFFLYTGTWCGGQHQWHSTPHNQWWWKLAAR